MVLKIMMVKFMWISSRGVVERVCCLRFEILGTHDEFWPGVAGVLLSMER